LKVRLLLNLALWLNQIMAVNNTPVHPACAVLACVQERLNFKVERRSDERFEELKESAGGVFKIGEKIIFLLKKKCLEL